MHQYHHTKLDAMAHNLFLFFMSRVAQEKLVFCCSNMEPGVKQEVKQLAEALGTLTVHNHHGNQLEPHPQVEH